MFRPTYRQGDLSAFGDLLGEHAQEVQDAGVTRDVVPEGRDHGGQHVLPGLHLDGQDGEAHAELDAHRLGARSELLEQQQELAA